MYNFINGICILCDFENIKSTPFEGYGSAAYFNCPNCGFYLLSSLIFPPGHNHFTSETKLILSYYIRNNQLSDKAVFIDKNNYDEIIKNYILPSTAEQLNNLLKWFGKESNNSLDSIDGFTKNLTALIGVKNQVQVINLLDRLQKDGDIEMETPEVNLRDRPTFNGFCGHLTIQGINKLDELSHSNSPINFSIPLLPIEKLLKDESKNLEIKGSLQLDLNHLLKNKSKQNNIDLGVLKTITAFLNSFGGDILIGAVEKDKFSQTDINKIKYKLFSDYYLIGILIEKTNIDAYQLRIRDLISSHISKEVSGLVDIVFPEFEGFVFCNIRVIKAKHKWYYLDKKFYVRDGNRTKELLAEDADNYKKINNRK